MRVTYGSYRVLKEKLGLQILWLRSLCSHPVTRGLSTENRIVLLIDLDNTMDKVY